MPPVIDLLLCLALFIGLVFGLGLPLVVAFPLRDEEKICATAVVSLILIYLAAFVIYWTHLPLTAFSVLPAGAILLLTIRRRICLALLRSDSVRHLLGAWLLVAGWSLGFLALIRNYSGGAWMSDWLEHWQRACFFLQHQPVDRKFVGGYLLSARPPLANLVNGAFLALTKIDFPHQQVFNTLVSSLAFLPAHLLAGWMAPAGVRRVQALLVLLLMSNPAFMENLTFGWTKLSAVFFVLTGLYFFLRGLGDTRQLPLVGSFVCLVTGMLAHYSAGPYLVVLALAFLGWRRRDWASRRFWCETIWSTVLGGLLLVTWLAWSLKVYGFHGTFLTNTTFTGSQTHSLGAFLCEKIQNIANTLIPHPFRTVDYSLISQTSRLGFVRDYVFMIYQTNLPFALGSAGGLLVCWLLWIRGREDGHAGLSRAFWFYFVSASLLMGIAAIGGVDDWGLAHICLQPLIVLGFVFLAANFHRLGPGLRGVFVVGACVDFALGVVLQYYLESRYYSRTLLYNHGGLPLAKIRGPSTVNNLLAKDFNGLTFVGDWSISRPLILASLICLLLLAIMRLQHEIVRRAPS